LLKEVVDIMPFREATTFLPTAIKTTVTCDGTSSSFYATALLDAFIMEDSLFSATAESIVLL
jgi:hypothetical protein